MGQAFRSRVAGAGAADSLIVTGCYNHDQKVVVEWERPLTETDLAAIFNELPQGHITFATLRLTASSWCRSRDTTLTSERITHYRLSRASVSALAYWAEERGLFLALSDSKGSGPWQFTPHSSL